MCVSTSSRVIHPPIERFSAIISRIVRAMAKEWWKVQSSTRYRVDKVGDASNKQGAGRRQAGKKRGGGGGRRKAEGGKTAAASASGNAKLM